MGMFRNRGCELECKKCKGNTKTVGGYLVEKDGVFVRKQYRQCVECGERYVGYKDLKTNKVIFGGAIEKED